MISLSKAFWSPSLILFANSTSSSAEIKSTLPISCKYLSNDGVSRLVTCFVIFNILPYEPSSFTYNFRNQTIANVLSIDFFKTLLAYTGSFLMLFLIYKIRPCLNGTWLVKRAVDHGRYTLDIYLLQIIILEMIGGHLYKAYVKETGLNIIHSQGLLFEVVSTFICACIMMEFLVLVSVLINKNYYATKLLFYRDNNK